MFTAFKSVWKKSEAAVVVQNLLEHSVRALALDVDPKTTATLLVSGVWASSPDVFDGKFGQRPHKISVAASALATGISFFKEKDDRHHLHACTIALGNLLSEVEANGSFYPLASVDWTLLNRAGEILVDYAEQFTAPSTTQMNWDDWYAAYVKEAGTINSSLQADENGASLIDFMVDTPLRNAHQAGLDPVEQARLFAPTFDIATFGQ